MLRGESVKIVHVKKIIVEVKEIVMPVFAVILFMTFIVSQNKIPSPSMVDTLRIGDRLLVSRLPFYYRSPERGEIVVFDGPDGKPWIKRVVGMPGEVIDIKEGNIYINGTYFDESAYLHEEGISALNPYEPTVVQYPYTVPEGHYFLMGDNRLESKDCRYIGAIADGDITGKALFKVYPFTEMGLLK